MAVMTINDQPVSRALLSVPRIGRAVIHARLASDDEGIGAGINAQVIFDDGSARTMTITRAVLERGAWSINAVAGFGGFGKSVLARVYSSIPAQTMLADLLRESGEQAGAIDAPEQFPIWVRRSGRVIDSLEAILDRLPERSWRVLPDGKTSVIREVWPKHPDPLTALSVNAIDGTYTMALEPSVQPGTGADVLVDGSRLITVRIERVIHSIEANEQRTEIQVSQ